MKKLLLTALVLCAGKLAFSQSAADYIQQGKQLRDARERLAQLQSPPGAGKKLAWTAPWRHYPTPVTADTTHTNIPSNTDAMPVAALQQQKLAFQYNNGHGMDIYTATPDQMPVAKPDAGFHGK